MGTKAMLVEEYATTNGIGSIRFDYLGHGDSDGEFMILVSMIGSKIH